MHAYKSKSAMCIFSICLFHCYSADGHTFCLAGEILRFEWNSTNPHKLHAADRWPSLSRIHFNACVWACFSVCVCLGGVEICRSESKIQVHVVHDFILVHNVADLKTLLFIFTWMLKVFTHKCCGARWLAFIAGVVCSPFGCAHIPRKRKTNIF